MMKCVINGVYAGLLSLVLLCPQARSEECLPPRGATEENPVDPSPQLTSVLSRIRQHDTLSLRYEQIKKIAVLTKPLVSSGLFSLRDGREIEFKQENPFQQKIIVRAEEIIRESDDGKRESIAVKSLPFGGGLSNTLLSLFSNDASAVLRLFSVSLLEDKGETKLSLLPKDEELQRLLTSIGLTVREGVHQIVLCEANGDRTVINFHR